MEHMILHLESPLMSFGGETIDNYGVIRPFPAMSMLTGMLANAMGWRRVERIRHQELQDRMVYAVRIDREPAYDTPHRDFQTARLYADDKGWTTRGTPEGRRGSSYNTPHLRYRDYHADMCVTVALRFRDSQDSPTIYDVAEYLMEPVRPIFIGRKSCLPSEYVFGGFVDGDTAMEALLTHPLVAGNYETVRAMWPYDEGADGIEESQSYVLTDQRNWVSGLHGGGRLVCQGDVPKTKFR